MIVYKDMAFCSRKDCKTRTCLRHWSKVEEYWNSFEYPFDDDRLPVSLCEFKSCKGYRGEENGED